MINKIQNPIITLFKKQIYSPQKNMLVFKGNNTDRFIRTTANNNTQVGPSSFNEDTYDTFTGLKDKKTLLRTIEKLISSKSKKIYLAMFDIDNFKSINEFLGYKTGDEFIIEIAKIIKEEAQKENFEGYRFGGEEFIILGSNSNDEKTEELCRRILERFKKSKIIAQFEKEYIKKCEKQLNELLEVDSLLGKIKKAEISYKLLSELAKTDSTLLDNSSFKKQLKKSRKSYKRHLIKFTLFAIEHENDSTKKSTLTELHKKLAQEKPKNYKKLFKTANILEHLLNKYENQDKIQQIIRWLNVHKKNKGFSATCSIIKFSPDTQKSPMELVDTAGEKLKQGKNQKKGEIYLKTS